MITEFLITVLIVGFVTAGLNIRFDRFFTILLLLFVFEFTIYDSINIFLWVIMFGALMIILSNKEKIASLPKSMLIKLFTVIPLITLVFSFIGTWFYSITSTNMLMLVLGLLALAYGIRLIFVHFKPEELANEKENPIFSKFCGIFGTIVSGFSIGFIGTSLKPLKIPFAVKIGKLNIKKVYIANTVIAFFASVFAIIFHYFFTKAMTLNIFYEQMILGLALWASIHAVFELTNTFFKDNWRKGFQIFIGLMLIIVSFKIFVGI